MTYTRDNFMVDYNVLIIRFLNGDITNEEVDILTAWVKQSNDNKNEFLRMRIAWLASAPDQSEYDVDPIAALDNLNRKIKIRGRSISQDSTYNLKKIISIAASFLLIFFIGSLVAYLIMKSNFSDQTADNSFIYIYAPKGSKAKTILQDGTTVWLNAGSNLMYSPQSFGKTDRQVTLIGEGFFKVAENAEKPFIVNAKDFQIVALGTEFNVKAYPDEDLLEATLVEGLVKIIGENQNNQTFSITLKPKQHVILPTGKTVINNVTLTDPDKIEAGKLAGIIIEKSSLPLAYKQNISNIKETDLFTSWKDDKWILKGEQLGNLAIMLERRFNIKIDFKSDELKKYRFTGTFQNETLEQVMQVLKLTAPLQYEIEKGKVTLSLDPALKKKYEKYLNNY